MDVISRRLLFRIGTVGFCLNLNELIEIREQVTERIDFDRSVHRQPVVGTLSFRGGQIPVVSIAERLGLSPDAQAVALVLNCGKETWALLVDRVEGFASASEMIDWPVPPILRTEGWRCFEQITLYAGSPFLRLDLLSCYVGGAE